MRPERQEEQNVGRRLQQERRVRSKESLTYVAERPEPNLVVCSGSKVRTPIAINHAARATFESDSSLLGRFLGIRGTVVATMNERL